MKPTFFLSSILLLMFHVLTTGQTKETRIDSMKLFQVTGSPDSILIEDEKYHYVEKPKALTIRGRNEI